MVEGKKTTATKSTEAAKRVPGMIKGLLAEARNAHKEGKFIAYTLIDTIYDEVVEAMDIVGEWVENYAGVCAAKQDAQRFFDRAHSEGFSSELCSYLRCSLGFDAMREELGKMPPDAPWGGLVKPDMMLGSSMAVCDVRVKSFQAAQQYMPEVPVYLNSNLWPHYEDDIDFREIQDYYVKYNTEELRRLVRFLEEQTGKKMDWDRLSEIVDLTDKLGSLFYEIGQLRKAVPCPMGAEDHMTTMVPCQFMMARKGVYEFYKDLYAEVKYKVDNKIGIVPEEKYRLLMEGGPPWYALNTYDYFKKHGAVFPTERVYNLQLPVDLLDIPKVSDPLEHIAWRKFKFTVHWHDAARRLGCCPDVARWIEQIDDYKIDGIVQFRNYSCRAFNLSTFTYLDMVKRYRDIPTLLIEGDLADINFYSEADTHSRIDTFIEILDQSKRSK